MPTKPKHPCAYQGCPELIPAGERYCEKHRKMRNKEYERYGRSPATRHRYGRNWQKIRKRYITAHPLCEACLKEGRVTLAEQVHHIKPLSEGGGNEESNLMSLCASCHSKIHAKRGDRWHGRGGSDL